MTKNNRGLRREAQKLQKLVQEKTGTEINYTTALRMLEEIKNNKDEKFQKTIDVILNLRKFDAASSIYQAEFKQIITIIFSMVTHMRELPAKEVPDCWDKILLDDYSNVNTNVQMFYTIIEENNLETLVNHYINHYPKEKDYIAKLINGDPRTKHCLSEIRGTVKDYLDANSIGIVSGVVSEEQILSSIMDGKSVFFINEDSGYGDFVNGLSKEEQSAWRSLVAKLARSGKEYNTSVIISVPRLNVAKYDNSIDGHTVIRAADGVWNNEVKEKPQPDATDEKINEKTITLANNLSAVLSHSLNYPRDTNAIMIGQPCGGHEYLWDRLKDKYLFDDSLYNNKYNDLQEFCSINYENSPKKLIALDSARIIFIHFNLYKSNPDLFASIVNTLMADKLVCVLIDHFDDDDDLLNELNLIVKRTKDKTYFPYSLSYYYTINSNSIIKDLTDANDSYSRVIEIIDNHNKVMSVIKHNENCLYSYTEFNTNGILTIKFNDKKTNGISSLLSLVNDLKKAGANYDMTVINYRISNDTFNIRTLGELISTHNIK